MDEIEETTTPLVADRSCDGCTMCCKLMTVAALNKPHMVWCEHCSIGVGCKIYSERPKECADFHCAYRQTTKLGNEWRPTDCKMVVNFESVHNRINVCVDPSRGSAWRQPPYFRQIKNWATEMLRHKGHLVVWEGPVAIVVLPDREVHLGELGDKIVVVMGRTTPLGEEYDALALAPDDPRLAQYKPKV